LYVWGLPNKPRVVYSNLGQHPIAENVVGHEYWRSTCTNCVYWYCRGKASAICANLSKVGRHGLPFTQPVGPPQQKMIWIDALCINQGDLSERDQQVRLMAEIYVRAASRVIIWLETLKKWRVMGRLAWMTKWWWPRVISLRFLTRTRSNVTKSHGTRSRGVRRF
jgi:hypothetical protein